MTDRHTRTEADAGLWARAHGTADDDERPTAAEAAHDAYLDRLDAARPRPVRSLADDVLAALCWSGGAAPSWPTKTISAVNDDVVRFPLDPTDDLPALAVSFARDGLEVKVVDGTVFARRTPTTKETP
jgi:hypothetical protein